jgi:glycerate dehydrogenase
MAQASTKSIFLDLETVDQGDLSLDALKQVSGEWIMLQKYPGNLTEVAQGCDVLVTNKVVITREHLQQLPDLKLICVTATGTNNIDLVAARERGIDVCNATAYATPSVVQYVFAVLLQLYSRVQDYERGVQRGDWSKSDMFCVLNYQFHELQGKTMGIYGYGELGQGVAKVAKAFGMQVLVAARDDNDNREGRIPLHELLPQVDVLSLHCPLTDNTRNLITAKELAMMKSNAIIINSARGGIVNEQDLIQALKSHQLGGAAIDVLTQEPPPPDHDMLTFKHHNLVVTPHVAWASIESRQRVIDQVAENIRCYFKGKPRNVVN